MNKSKQNRAALRRKRKQLPRPRRASLWHVWDVLPDSGIAGRTLTTVMSIMCYLACIALGGLILINKSIGVWTTDISRQITVQIRPVAGIDMDLEINKAVDILKQTDGVTDMAVLTSDDTAALLEPWLGKSDVLNELPVPRLIEIGVDANKPPDLKALAARLHDQVVGASLDTHRRWQNQLLRTGGSLRLAGFGILLLISLATVAIIVFATRSAMDSNRRIIEVLHLVGAHDQFIAQQVQRHFLRLALKGGMTGAVLGIFTFMALGWFAGSRGPDSSFYPADNLLSGAQGFALLDYVYFLLVPIAAALISVLTARFAVMRILAGVL